MKRAFLNLHAAVFLAGFTGVLGKLITLNESLLVWYRLLITVISMALLFFIQGKFPRVSFKILLQLSGVGLIIALHWIAFYGSIKYSNVSVALVCFSLVGFFSALLEPLLSGSRFSLPEVLLGLLAVAGVYFIFRFDTQYRTGIVFGVICAVLAALFTILNKKMLLDNDPQTVTFYELTGGFVLMSVLLPMYLHASQESFSWPLAPDWGWLIVLSWFCTVLAFYCSLTALKSISSFTVNLTYNLEPVYGILLAFLIFKENKELGTGFYIGLTLIMLAVLLQTGRLFYKRL